MVSPRRVSDQVLSLGVNPVCGRGDEKPDPLLSLGGGPGVLP